MTSDSQSIVDGNSTLVSVGIPAYNEAERLETAVRQLLSQSYANLELIISDNASDDQTEAIGRRLGESDSRVVYVRQSRNIGPIANFRYVLEAATGAYFMWAAPDDEWDPTYVEKNLARLLDDQALVCSVSKVRWIRDGSDAGLTSGTWPLRGSERKKTGSYLRYARDNSRFYGVFIRDVLLSAYPPRDFFAADIATMLGTLGHGDHGELDEVLMTRNRNDPMGYISMVDSTNTGWLSRWFPMLPLTRYALSDLGIPLSPTTVGILLARNIYDHFRYAALHRTPYGAFARLILKISSRLRARAVGDTG